MNSEGSIPAQRLGSHLGRNFAVGMVTSTTVLLLACGVLVPRYAELEALGEAVIQVALLTGLTGIALCVVKRFRAAGAGVVAGAVLGVALAWFALTFYVGLFQR